MISIVKINFQTPLQIEYQGFNILQLFFLQLMDLLREDRTLGNQSSGHQNAENNQYNGSGTHLLLFFLLLEFHFRDRFVNSMRSAFFFMKLNPYRILPEYLCRMVQIYQLQDADNDGTNCCRQDRQRTQNRNDKHHKNTSDHDSK